jgi:hypothetical protein
MRKDGQHLLIGAASLLVLFLLFRRFIAGLQQHTKITWRFNIAMLSVHRK